MNSIIDYRGHIRNWKQLCEELEIADSLAREEREREIVLKACCHPHLRNVCVCDK